MSRGSAEVLPRYCRGAAEMRGCVDRPVLLLYLGEISARSRLDLVGRLVLLLECRHQRREELVVALVHRLGRHLDLQAEICGDVGRCGEIVHRLGAPS